MIRLVPVAALLMLNGCILFRSDPTGCEAVADRDPAVADYQAKAASAPQYIGNHLDDYRIARLRAVQKCERERGVIPPGGGVAPYRAPS